MFIAIPLCLVTATSVSGAAPTQTPSTASWALQCLKSGYHNLIHQADLQIDGKTVSDTQPFLGAFTHIKLLSELSQNDLRSIGTAIGFSEVLDSVGSTRWNGNAVDRNGTGLTNNTVFGSTTQVTADDDQNTGVCNEAINKRVLKTIDGTKAGFNGIVTNIVSADQLKAEFKTVYQVQNTNYGIVYDLALIRLKDIFDCMNNIGLVKRFNGVLRLYINTGALQVTCVGNNTVPNYSFNVGNSTFNNVCPFTINNLGLDNGGGGIKTNETRVTVGLFIGKALQTSQNGVNLGASGASHPMQACRLYYSSILMEPDKSLLYSRQNQAKKVVFRNYYFNQINAVGSGGTYSQLIQSGIRNPYALIVVPYISSTVAGMSGYQWQSPFDTAPATGSPCILENLQVSLGGIQVLSSPYYYGFEDYMTQYVNAESLSSSDFGVSCGVVSKEWWEANRVYWINLSRSTKADRMTPRNVNLSFKNASMVPIDVLVYTVYLDSFTINIDSGAVSTSAV